MLPSLWLTGSLAMLVAQSAWADIVPATEVQLKPMDSNPEQPISNIPRLSEIEFPLTSAKWLTQQPMPAIPHSIGEGFADGKRDSTPLENATRTGNGIASLHAKSSTIAQANAPLVQVTAVRLNPTKSGLDVILETADGSVPQVTTSSDDRTFLIDISNARLSLPEGENFRADYPASGITSVTVTRLHTNSIRVTVTGEVAVPKAEVLQKANGLVVSLTPEVSSTAVQPTPTPPIPDEKPTQPTPQTGPNEEEIEVVVTGQGEEGYGVPNASTATRTETLIRDIPQSIQVIPRQVIEDRQVVRLSELSNNASGVQQVSGYGGLSSQSYIIRGFESSETLRNGFRDFSFTSPRDIANIEQVEILKGPASVLYGGGSTLSGIVNTTTKKPLAESRYAASMTIGSEDFYRAAIDITGPLNDDKSLLYRINLAYENAGSYRDFNENESIFVAPAITWQIGPRTTLNVEFEYQDYNYTFDRGFPPDPIVLELPVRRFLGEPDYNYAEFDSFSATYNFEHRFSENWRFRQGFNALIINGDTKGTAPADFSAPFLEADGRTFERQVFESDEEQENYALQNEIFGKFQTGSIHHNVLLGVELARYRFAYSFVEAPLAAIDIFNPQYGAKPGTLVPSYSPEEYGARNLGVYVQDLIEVLPNLKILAGVRFDSNDSFYRNEDKTTNLEQSETNFSPRIGIVYQPSESTSLYANWTNSFNPQIFSRSRTGEAFTPEIGEQFEVGIKQEFLDNRLSATLALYQITKQNVLTTDPNEPNFSIQTGEQKSRGVELDIAGEILPGWKLIATYAYTDAFVSKDNSLPVDDRLYNVPLHSASLWTTYEIQSGNLKGLGFGLGLVYASEREARLPNTFKLPSYVRADASIFYRWDNYRIGLNVKNIFNTEYYRTQGFYITPEPPLTVLGTFAAEF
jgi:iron complex outermembrane receptor protein